MIAQTLFALAVPGALFCLRPMGPSDVLEIPLLVVKGLREAASSSSNGNGSGINDPGKMMTDMYSGKDVNE